MMPQVFEWSIHYNNSAAIWSFGIHFGGTFGYTGLVSPKMMRWKHFLSSSLDLVPRHAIALYFIQLFVWAKKGMWALAYTVAGRVYHQRLCLPPKSKQWEWKG
jgi:hypothetical protein